MKQNDSLDDILEEIGDFGRLQIVVLLLIYVNVFVNSATHVAYVFTALDSDFR